MVVLCSGEGSYSGPVDKRVQLRWSCVQERATIVLCQEKAMMVLCAGDSYGGPLCKKGL